MESTCRIHVVLFCAIGSWDKRQAKKPGYNPYAMGHYCGALRRSTDMVESGQCGYTQALERNFCGPLLKFLLKEIAKDEKKLRK